LCFHPSKITLPQNLHSTFLGLSFDIKYHGLHMFHLPTINKTLYTRKISLINIIKVFNNNIKFHLEGYNSNSAPIAHAIWQFEIQISINVSSLPRYMAMVGVK
jgi:hypothetical protein